MRRGCTAAQHYDPLVRSIKYRSNRNRKCQNGRHEYLVDADVLVMRLPVDTELGRVSQDDTADEQKRHSCRAVTGCSVCCIVSKTDSALGCNFFEYRDCSKQYFIIQKRAGGLHYVRRTAWQTLLGCIPQFRHQSY